MAYPPGSGIGGGSGGTTDHTALTNRDAEDQHPAGSVSVDVTNFNRNLGPEDDTVQKALDKLDELVGGEGLFLGWYETSTDLSTAHPTGIIGNYAFIYETDSIWAWETDAWANTYRKSNDLEPLNPTRNCLTAWNDNDGTYLRNADQNAYVPNGLFVRTPHSSGNNRYKVKAYGDLSTESYAGLIDITGYLGAYYQNYPGIGLVCNMIESVNSARFGAGLLISGHQYSYGIYNTTTLSPYIALAIKPAGGSVSEPLKIGPDGIVRCNPGISATSMNITGGTYNINGTPHAHDATYMSLSGGTLTGNLDLDNNRISNVADPVNGKDAVNLDTVSGIIVGMKWQDPIEDIVNDPPDSPSEGDRYLVGTTPTGAFIDHDNEVATWNGSNWDYEIPEQGWCVSNKTDNYAYNFNGTFWAQLPGATSHSALQNLGVDDHSQYVHSSNARTISARHTFSNAIPFTVTSDTMVSNLNAQYLGGAVRADFAEVLHEHGIADLSDFQIIDLQDGQILKYDVGTGKFVNVEDTGAFSLDPNHQFVDATARDVYFGTTNPEELENGLFIAVGEEFQQYNGEIDPYDNTNWVSRTAVIRGPAGANGVNGTDGAQGPQGPQGLQGPAGEDGLQGPPGSPGTSINMQGSVATTDDLPASGNTENDGYYCEADGDCYVWTGSEWVNVGPIVGPQGLQGPRGLQGIQGIQGPIGLTGPQGEIGPVGPVGPVGPRGPSGYDNPYYQEAVEGIMDAPPEVYDYTDRFIVSDTPNGDWVGHNNQIATWIDTDQWYFETPEVGWALYDLQDTVHRVWNGSVWSRWESIVTAASATVDTTNFDNNLTSADNTVQKALETLDELITSGGTPSAHASSHISTGSDAIANAVAGGASGLMSGADKTKLDGIAAGAEVNVQADWNQSNTEADDYIKNKPTIPSEYTLPTASDIVLGGVKVGSRLTITDGVLSADEQGGGLVKVSSNDTTAGYLGSKLIAGSGITLTENNDAGNETLSVGVNALFTKVSTAYTLPASPSDGYIVDIVGIGNNWVVTANSGQYIRMGSNISVSGGTLSSGSEYDCATLIYIGNSTWLVKANNGILTLDA